MLRTPLRTSLLHVKYSDSVLATSLFQLVSARNIITYCLLIIKNKMGICSGMLTTEWPFTANSHCKICMGVWVCILVREHALHQLLPGSNSGLGIICYYLSKVWCWFSNNDISKFPFDLNIDDLPGNPCR